MAGLYYYRVRYYSPVTGRFISEDPIGFGGGINVYAYVGSSPIDFIDPFGLDRRDPLRPNCLGAALEKNGVALALDLTSLGVDVAAPEGQYVKLAWGLGLGTAAAGNSAYHQDLTGAGMGMAGYLRATTALAVDNTAAGWAKWIPGVGAGFDVLATIHDISQTANDYSTCTGR